MKKSLICAMAVVCAAIQLSAMPTEEETKQAEPVVKKLLAQERAAFESGKKTRSEVAAAAMKLVGEADTDAAKLLLMKGAFALYVKDGNLEKAVETMKTLEATISDMPPQSVTNMIEVALLGVSKKEDGARIYKLLYSASNAMKTKDVRLSAKEEVKAKDVKFAALDAVKTSEVKLPYEVVDGAVVLGKRQSFGYGCQDKGELKDERKVVTVKITSGELDIPDEIAGIPVRSIGTGAFADCKGLVSVTIPSSVTSIAENAFTGRNGMSWSQPVSGLKSFSVNSDNPSYSSRNGMLCTKDGSTLVAGVIGVNGSVTIPSSVVSIGSSAFSNCSGLRCVTIPDSVTSIGSGAFRNCRGLISVAIPSSVERIGHGAFYGCSGLTSVTIADGVASIGDSAFSGCEKLKSVTIPSSVESIGRSAFTGCGGLMSIVVGAENANYKSVNGMVLSKDGTTLIVGVNGDVTIPDGVTSIEEAAFFNRWSLKSLSIPDSVTRIGESAFNNCKGLKSVTIPDSVTSIGRGAFTGCSVSFTVGAGNPSYKSVSGWLLTKDGTTLVLGRIGDVNIPDGVTRIGKSAFFNCWFLKSVTIPNSVTNIESAAFGDCYELTCVTIPDSVTSIGREAFLYCHSLATVTMLGERPDAPNDIFKGCGNLKAIHVPANAKSWAGMKDWFGIPLECDIEANHW